jgi:CYTH domain-containing protein
MDDADDTGDVWRDLVDQDVMPMGGIFTGADKATVVSDVRIVGKQGRCAREQFV